MEKAATVREYYNDTYLYESKAKVTLVKTPDPSKQDVH
jgi:hypothetical protein